MSPADVRSIKRKQGQVTVPGVFPKYRIGSLIGTDVSKRTVSKKKVDPREVKVHYDYNHQVTQTQVAYFGFKDAGSADEQLSHGCLALAQMIYRRAGVFATHEDMSVQGTTATTLMRIDAIRIQFNSIAADGVTGHFENTITAGISTGTITLDGLRDAIKAAIVDRASNYAAWPVTMQILKVGAVEYDILQSYDLTNVMVHFAAMQKYKYQNITPSGNIGAEVSTVNDVQANPLSGRVYQFKHPVPRLRPVVKENDEKDFPLDNLAKIEDAETNTLACEAFRTASLYSNGLKLGFKQPFKAVGVFDNCTHEDKVYMPPGGYKQLIRKTAVVMNFKRFVMATFLRDGSQWVGMNNELRVPRIGTSTLWALEPAVRTSVNETTKLIVNRELWLTAKCVLGKERQIVRAKTIVSDGTDFGSS